MDISKTGDQIQIKIVMLSPNQKYPAPTKAPKKDLKDMDVLCNFKIKIRETKFGTLMYQRQVTISKSR